MSEERDSKNPSATGKAQLSVDGRSFQSRDGAVLIAEMTSCTNTSNPYVMIAAGLLARNARRRGLNSRPWVKTSLAPGSRVVSDYLSRAGLLDELGGIGFDLVGYGCTTCIGNSGPLKPEIAAGVRAGDVIGCAVLSGNRNFDGRIHPDVKMNYLGPPAAGGRLRPGGFARCGPQHRTARCGERWQAGVPEGHLAQRPRSRGLCAAEHQLRDVPAQLRERLQGR